MADSLPELSISRTKICFVVQKAREFDAKDVLTDPADGSNPSDDGMISVLEDHRNDPVVRELTEFVHALSEDEQIDLVALTWLGRGDGNITDWESLRAEAACAQRPDSILSVGNASLIQLSRGRALQVRWLVHGIRGRPPVIPSPARARQGSPLRIAGAHGEQPAPDRADPR